MVNNLRRAHSCLNVETHNRVFTTTIKYHDFFAATIWGDGSTAKATKMNAAVTHAVRIIHRDPKAELNNKTFKSLGILPFRELVFYFNFIKILSVLESSTTDNIL